MNNVTALEELTFQEDCQLAIGNWLIDTFHLQCGIPLLWIALFLFLTFFTAFIVYKKTKKKTSALITLLLGLFFYFAFRIFLIWIYYSKGLLLKSEILEQVGYIFVVPFYTLLGFFRR